MINNRNQFKNAIKENMENITLTRVYNFDKENKIEEGSIGKVVYRQSNAIRVKYNTYDKELWLYFNNEMALYDVKDNQIIYYNYIDGFNKEKEQEQVKKLEDMGIEVIKIGLDDKVNEGYNKGDSNCYYTYKYVDMINKIEVA